MRKLLHFFVFFAVIAAAFAWFLSRPEPLNADAVAGLTGDSARGENLFWAGGCSSCHAAPNSEGEEKLVLAGGYRINSPFGTFISPNISPSANGIGGWSNLDLANALIRGLSPVGSHYYPSFPYGTYTRMSLQDVVDLKAFLDTLPSSETQSQPHELPFPVTIRRSVGLWKRLFLTDDWIVAVEGEQLERGRYLVEALGHCGECHTPRNVLGALDDTRWLEGADNPSGEGRIPGLAPGQLNWGADDIAYYLETGFTPDYDSAGGEMAAVIANTSQLTEEDRAAIAAYIKAIP